MIPAAFMLVFSSVFGALTVTSVTPSSGGIEDEESVTLNGTGFNTVTEVLFGSVKAPYFQINSDTTLVAKVPTPIGPAGLVHVKVSNGETTSYISYQNKYIYSRSGWLAYLSQNVGAQIGGSIIPNPLSRTASTPPKIPLNGSPYNLAIYPNNSRLYATNAYGPSDYSLVVIDIAKNQVIAEIPYAYQPMDIAISPRGSLGYVIYGNKLSEINLSNDTIAFELTLPYPGTQLAISPDGLKAYISHYNNGQISVVDLTLNRVVKSISLPKAYSIGVEPSGNYVYIGTDQYCYALETNNDTIVRRFNVGRSPRALAVNPNGNEVCVANFQDNTVTVIQLTNGSLVTIPVGKGPISIAVSPDGKIGYVANSIDGTMTILDLVIHKVLTTEPINPSLSGIVVTVDQSPVANFQATSADGFLTYNFDASSSITPVGEITTYTWVFEGSPVTTTSPFITYEFGTPGTYPVTLTVTNSAGTSTTQAFTGKTMSRNGSYLAQIVKNVNVPWPTLQ